jgi:hypothetical protein
MSIQQNRMIVLPEIESAFLAKAHECRSCFSHTHGPQVAPLQPNNHDAAIPIQFSSLSSVVSIVRLNSKAK